MGILGILLVSTASASQLNETDISQISEDDDLMEVDAVGDDIEVLTANDSSEIEEISQTNETEVIGNTHTPKSFSELQTSIESANGGDTIIVDGHYLFTSALTFSKSLNFIGINDATFDGDSNVGLIVISGYGGSASFKNITFQNGKSDLGGAINGVFNVENCKFINNYAVWGGALYGGGTVVNCTFEGNSGEERGGAIYDGSYGGTSVLDCTFIDNSVSARNPMRGLGGAIYEGYGTIIDNCVFVNNSASGKGGAIYYSGKYVRNSVFTSNHAYSAGAIFTEVKNFDITECSFNSNYADFDPISNCFLTVNDLSITYGDDGYLIANLFDVSGPLKDKVIVFIHENIEYFAITDSNGRATFNIKNNITQKGQHSVSVNFADDVSYSTISNSSHVTINYNSSLTIEDLSSQGKEGFLILHLFDAAGPLENKSLKITVEGHEFDAVTDDNGLSNFNIKDHFTDLGSYPVVVNYAGGEFNHPVSTSSTVTLTKYDPVLTVNNLSIVKGDVGILNISLSNKKGPLSHEVIHLIVNGESVDKSITSAGFTTFNIKDSLKDVGEYTIAIIFDGNELNNPVSKNVSVRINEYFGELSVNQIGKYYNDTFLNFNLVNSRNNTPVANASIRVIFSNDVSLNLTTDVNGVASYSVPFAPGNYTFSAAVADDNVEVNEIGPTAIEINEIVGVIEIRQNGTGYNHSDLIFKLYNPNNGDVYRNIPINLIFVPNSGSARVTTNDEGTAIYKIPFDIGTYQLLAYVSSDYASFEDVLIDGITIEKYDADVIFSNELIFPYGDYGSANLTVIGGTIFLENIRVVNHTEATILFEDNVVTVTGLGVGSYILNITINPDSNHYLTSKTFNIIVNKMASNVGFTGDVIFNYGEVGSTKLILDGCSVDKKNITVRGHDEAKIDLIGDYVTVSGLAAGVYTLEVISTPDDAHSSVTRTAGITVNKINSSVSFADVVFDYGSSNVTTLILEGCAVDLENISIIGYDKGKINLDGNVINISDLGAGFYTLQVVSTPDENHTSVVGTANIWVYKVDSVVSFEDVVFNYGGSGSTTLVLDGCSVDWNNIRVIGHDEASIKLDGNEITISNLAADNYTLQVISTPDENHTSVVGTANIRVDKIDSSVSFDDVTFYYGDSGHVTLHCIGCSVKESDIEVVGHEAKIKLNVNEITISNLTVDTYTLKVVTTPDANHTSITKTGKITVIKSNSSVEFSNDIIFNFGGRNSTKLILNGCSVDYNSIRVVGQNAKIDLKGNEVTVSGLNAGSYNLSVTTKPDSNHISVTGYCPIIVKKVKADITFTNTISFTYGGSGSTTISVTGGTVSKSNIWIVGNKKAPVTYVGNVIGVSGLAVGNYMLSVTVTPDANHNSVTEYVGVTVSKSSSGGGSTPVKVKSEIKLGDPIVFYYGGSGSTTVSVFGGSVSTKTIKVDGQSKAKIKLVGKKIVVSGLKVGSYTLRVSSIPYKNYYSTVETLRITVKKIPVSIKASKVSVVYKKSKVWTIKLVNTKTKKGIANTVVKLKIFTGKKFTTKKVRTNSKGVAKYKISPNLSIGKHKVVLSMSKKGHVCKSLTSRITVKPIKLSFEVTSKYQNTGSMVSVWVKNKKTPANNIKVKMLVYTGSKITKKFTLTTGNYKSYKGFVGYGTNALSVGKHKVVVKPLSKIYAGSGQTTMIIQKGANKYGTGYSLVSKGKLTLH